MSEGNTKTWQTPCKCSFCFDYRMNQTFQYVSGWVNLWDNIWMFFFSLGTEKVEKCKVCVNSVFSLTWPASMQIYWNKKKKRLHKKRVQLPQDWFGTPTWPPFHCFGKPIWPPWRHVKTQYIHERRSQKQTFCRTFLFHMSSCFCRTATLRFFNILRRHSLHILQFTICLVILWLSTVSNSLREKLQAKH